MKYNQDSKIMTVNIGDDIKKSIPRRHQGLAGRVSYNWNYRYFADFNLDIVALKILQQVINSDFSCFSVAWNIAEETHHKEESEMDEYV